MYLEERSIMYLAGVGPKRAETLRKEANIISFEDMLYYFPYKYVDRSRFYTIREINGEMPYIQLRGRIVMFDFAGEGRTKRLIGKFTDGTGTIDLVWFQGLRFITEKYRVGQEVIVFGKPTSFSNDYNIVHPDIDPVEKASQVANGLVPFYNTTEKMKKFFLNSRAIQNIQYTLLSNIGWSISETLPEQILSKIKMMSVAESIKNIHFPESAEKLRQAQLRLKFDELFYIQLNILRTATLRRSKTNYECFCNRLC